MFTPSLTSQPKSHLIHAGDTGTPLMAPQLLEASFCVYNGTYWVLQFVPCWPTPGPSELPSHSSGPPDTAWSLHCKHLLLASSPLPSCLKQSLPAHLHTSGDPRRPCIHNSATSAASIVGMLLTFTHATHLFAVHFFFICLLVSFIFTCFLRAALLQVQILNHCTRLVSTPGFIKALVQKQNKRKSSWMPQQIVYYTVNCKLLMKNTYVHKFICCPKEYKNTQVP